MNFGGDDFNTVFQLRPYRIPGFLKGSGVKDRSLNRMIERVGDNHFDREKHL